MNGALWRSDRLRSGPILRADWIKGQITAIECGMLSSFEGASSRSGIMLPDGQTVLERIERDNVAASLPPPSH